MNFLDNVVIIFNFKYQLATIALTSINYILADVLFATTRGSRSTERTTQQHLLQRYDKLLFKKKSKMHQRTSNLCCCVNPVHELTKCVTEVPGRCSGLTTGPNGYKPMTRDNVAYICGSPRHPPRRQRCKGRRSHRSHARRVESLGQQCLRRRGGGGCRARRRGPTRQPRCRTTPHHAWVSATPAGAAPRAPPRGGVRRPALQRLLSLAPFSTP
jgi:hypothetical protein